MRMMTQVKTGIADDAGGEYEHCGMGACDPTGSIGNTRLGVCEEGWTDRDAWVDIGLKDLLRARERTACTRRCNETNQFDETGVGMCAKIREPRYAKLKMKSRCLSSKTNTP
jgi:hypothetical protein